MSNERRKALNDPDSADVKPAAISVREFKIVSGLSNATIFRLLKSGQLKSVKLHGRRLISFAEVERLREGKP